MHLLVNLSWRCNLACPYCLCAHIQINREAVEHSWQDWAEAFAQHLPRRSLIDFAGGEPTIFPGLPSLLTYLHEHGLRWAITTNAVDECCVRELVEARPGGCVLVNISDHPGNQHAAATRNMELLRATFPTKWNRVVHPDAGQRAVPIDNVIPYQRYREGTELDGKVRICDSGINHWVLDPGGNVFICNVAMATGRAPIGNLFTGKLMRPSGPFRCDWGCSSCYTTVPGAWGERSRVIA